MEGKWFQNCYRRVLIDSHIADWDEKFLSKLDPKNIIDMYSLAKVQSAMVYSCCHLGNCYWPTKVGHMHNGLKRRDALGEIIDLCHKKDIKVVIYYSAIYNQWAYTNFPEWRIIKASGEPAGENDRRKTCCPNSPYKDFVLTQIDEICAKYSFEGVFFDMTFWPAVCYCHYCQERFAKEVGEKMPKVIDWGNPLWVRFQRKREEWLLEFVSSVTRRVKRFNSEITVNHQAATFLSSANWFQGVPLELSDYCDYMGADFYNLNLRDMSFVCKLFIGLTRNKPPEFHTSRCYGLGDHTTIKPKELMEAQASVALANNSAFVFIDAIDPEGTLNPSVYHRIGEVFEETMKYEPYLGGELCKDIGLYYSLESKIDFSDNGKEPGAPPLTAATQPHYKAISSACQSILDNHLPFDVITRKNLKNLSGYKLVILPNLLAMDEDEVTAIREYVKNGGSLYASKYTSVYTKYGEKRKDFMLSDVFGVSYLGETREEITYVSPVEKENGIFPGFSAKYPLMNSGTQLIIKAKEGAKVLATITLPYNDPKEKDRYVSIHSNPPGRQTDSPAIVINKYGKGIVCYLAGNLEDMEFGPHSIVFINLVKMLIRNPLIFEVEAPRSVEVTLFHQESKKRYIINLINFQKELPNIPVEEITVKVNLKGKVPKRLIVLPEENKLPYELKDGCLRFNPPRLKTFLMIGLDYK